MTYHFIHHIKYRISKGNKNKTSKSNQLVVTW